VHADDVQLALGDLQLGHLGIGGIIHAEGVDIGKLVACFVNFPEVGIALPHPGPFFRVGFNLPGHKIRIIQGIAPAAPHASLKLPSEELHPGLQLDRLGHLDQLGLVRIFGVELLQVVAGHQEGAIAGPPGAVCGKVAKGPGEGEAEGEVINDIDLHVLAAKAELPPGVGVDVLIGHIIFPPEAHILAGDWLAV